MKNENAEERKSGFGSSLLHAVRHLVFHNGGFKLLAIAISVILWAGLISQDESLTREKTFNNVNVNIIGTDTMKRNGYVVVSDLDSLLSDVSITAAVPQRQYETAEASAFNLRLDLSRVNSTGEQEIRLSSTNSSSYGRVISTSPSLVTVNVEEYVVRQRIPVSVTIGEVPAQWYISSPTVDPTTITVAGPRSLVQTISRARATIDPETIEWKEGSIFTSVEFELFNRAGDVVSSPLLDITSDSLPIDSVLVEANILPTQTFDVADMIQTTGEVARGYEITDVRVSPEVITVAARGEVLAQMDELAIERTVNVRNLRETSVFQLKVQKPSEDAVLSNDTVTVTVEINKVEE